MAKIAIEWMRSFQCAVGEPTTLVEIFAQYGRFFGHSLLYLHTNTGAHYLKIRYSAAGPLLFFVFSYFSCIQKNMGAPKPCSKVKLGWWITFKKNNNDFFN